MRARLLSSSMLRVLAAASAMLLLSGAANRTECLMLCARRIIKPNSAASAPLPLQDRQAGSRMTGRLAGRQAGRQVGKQAGKQADAPDRRDMHRHS